MLLHFLKLFYFPARRFSYFRFLSVMEYAFFHPTMGINTDSKKKRAAPKPQEGSIGGGTGAVQPPVLAMDTETAPVPYTGSHLIHISETMASARSTTFI